MPDGTKKSKRNFSKIGDFQEVQYVRGVRIETLPWTVQMLHSCALLYKISKD